MTMSGAQPIQPLAEASAPPLGRIGRVLLLVLLAIGLAVSRADPFTAFFFVSYASLGALLAIRRPRHVIGWLLIVIAFGFMGTTSQPGIDVAAAQTGHGPLGEFVVIWASSWTGYATFGGFVALTLLFPSGRLPEGRWRPPAIAVLGAFAAAPTVSFNPDGGATTVLVPNRFAVLPELPLWDLVRLDLLVVPTIVLLAIGVGSILVRYRGAAGVVRLQLRWLVAALVFVVLAVAAGLASILVFPGIGGLAWLPAIAAYPTVPIAIYVAITRHRLYEIDRIISRTVGWLLVTAVLAGVFAGAVIGLQALLAPLTRNNALVVAASTLVAAGAFQPLRSRIQRLVDHRFNRARLDAERVTEGFAARLRAEVDLAAIDEDVRRTVSVAVAPSALGLWLRGTGDRSR
jgi:hypothetical protein